MVFKGRVNILAAVYIPHLSTYHPLSPYNPPFPFFPPSSPSYSKATQKLLKSYSKATQKKVAVGEPPTYSQEHPPSPKRGMNIPHSPAGAHSIHQPRQIVNIFLKTLRNTHKTLKSHTFSKSASIDNKRIEKKCNFFHFYA
jgi:hypothetical protein